MSSDHSSVEGEGSEDGEQCNHIQTTLLIQLVDAASVWRAAICCGGSIPIVANDEKRFENLTVDDGPTTSPPVVLRWDLPSGKAIRKLTLPPIFKDAAETVAIKELLKDCSPATFGKDGEEVLDKEYREALKLDNDQFSTNFSPHDVGIVDAIAQTLLPSIARSFDDGDTKFREHLGVAAELYKLNVSLPVC